MRYGASIISQSRHIALSISVLEGGKWMKEDSTRWGIEIQDVTGNGGRVCHRKWRECHRRSKWEWAGAGAAVRKREMKLAPESPFLALFRIRLKALLKVRERSLSERLTTLQPFDLSPARIKSPGVSFVFFSPPLCHLRHSADSWTDYTSEVEIFKMQLFLRVFCARLSSQLGSMCFHFTFFYLALLIRCIMYRKE